MRHALIALVLLAGCHKKADKAAPKPSPASTTPAASGSSVHDAVHEAAIEPKPGEKTFSFHITEPSGSRDVVVQRDVVKIGRVPSSQIVMQDDTVGRMHMLIEDGHERGINITDMGNGSSLNGKKLLGDTVPLHSGDMIELGASKITVTF